MGGGTGRHESGKLTYEPAPGDAARPGEADRRPVASVSSSEPSEPESNEPEAEQEPEPEREDNDDADA